MARVRKTLERLLLAIGVVLCLAFFSGLVYRQAASRRAVRAFRNSKTLAQSRVPKATIRNVKDLAVDFSLWSPKRIAAFKDALAGRFTAPLAILRVPKVGIEVPVFEGTDELNLNRGVGRIIGTAYPGQPGNIGIAGHRDGFFRALKDVAVGESLTLDTGTENARYVVERITIVDAADVRVLAPTATPSLTLVTCYPFYFVGDAPQRYIVRCARVTQNGINRGVERAK